MSPLSPAARRGGAWGAGAGGELGLEAFDLCLLSGEGARSGQPCHAPLPHPALHCCLRSGPSPLTQLSAYISELIPRALPLTARTRSAALRSPADSSTLFAVATDEGTVRLGTPAGRLPAPSVLTPDPDGRLKGADLGSASSLHAHPLFPDVVAAGFAFGGLCAFHSSFRKPLRRWSCATGDGGAGVLAVRWSAVRSSLLFVLDTAGTLRLFDVLREGDEPVHEERVRIRNARKRTLAERSHGQCMLACGARGWGGAPTRVLAMALLCRRLRPATRRMCRRRWRCLRSLSATPQACEGSWWL